MTALTQEFEWIVQKRIFDFSGAPDTGHAASEEMRHAASSLSRTGHKETREIGAEHLVPNAAFHNWKKILKIRIITTLVHFEH